MRVPLAVALVRDHRAAYAGVFVSSLVASLVVGASMLLFAAASAGDGLPAGDQAVAAQDAQLTAGLIAGIAVFGAVFLVSSSLGFVVGGRSRELGLLRLTGASGAQVGGLVLRETALVAGAAALLGAVGSVAVLRPYATLLIHRGLAPEGLDPAVRPGPALTGAALVWAAALVGAWPPAARVSRIEPAAAVQATPPVRSAMSPTRWVVGALGGAGAVVLLTLPASGADLDRLNSVMVGLAATSIVALTALAPVVVPSLAAALARLLSPAAPAGSLLAGRRVRFDAARTASLASPVVLLVGIGGALFGVAQTGQAAGFAAWETRIDAQVVVRDAPAASADDFRDVARTPGVTRATRYDAADLTLGDGEQPDARVAWTDATALAATAGLTVDAGGLAEVTGTSVAVRDGMADLGEVLTFTTLDGRPVPAIVVAVYRPAAFAGADVLVDHDTFPVAAPATGTWFVTTADADPVVAQLRATLPATATVDTTRAWLDDKIAAGRSGQTALAPTLLGVALLTVVALAMSLLTSLRERRQEFARLGTLGGGRLAIVGSTLVETAIVLATAALLLVGVLGALQLKTGQLLRAQHLDVQPAMPLTVLAATFGLMAVVAVVATVAGTIWATRDAQT
jgi:putative ABC transport system permease protein